ncbi:hypothetical protein ACQP0C_13610 [Nocardia sp. CA-129566]|uniref:hypothetical protein n=1 Tax=Nocardia sp. CA-129566 TaxID=3239976 RepID=UPI003D96E886
MTDTTLSLVIPGSATLAAAGRLRAVVPPLTHRLAQRLEQPKYLVAVRSAIQEVHGHAYDVRWVDRAPREAKNEMEAAQNRQRLRIRVGHVQDFDTVFDLLRMAGARYIGDDREFVIEGSTFTFQQVCALLELIRHPEQPQVESLWQPDPPHEPTSPE